MHITQNRTNQNETSYIETIDPAEKEPHNLECFNSNNQLIPRETVYITETMKELLDKNVKISQEFNEKYPENNFSICTKSFVDDNSKEMTYDNLIPNYQYFEYLIATGIGTKTTFKEIFTKHGRGSYIINIGILVCMLQAGYNFIINNKPSAVIGLTGAFITSGISYIGVKLKKAHELKVIGEELKREKSYLIRKN